ncbi:EPM2AIP1 [Cordylochernes scorpioides]|uniref:EPM2AIP1 n=1 Tax=Cordylochernes scorpioides TaxID=51811 RepID=A0ABY6KEL5_9ARAC|nr:EPM2AIP1 [Cordylochernes scorpioides]
MLALGPSLLHMETSFFVTSSRFLSSQKMLRIRGIPVIWNVVFVSSYVMFLLAEFCQMEKKRKIDSECRKFKDQWNIQYFVIESSNKALCLICNESIAVLKEYNMKRHYETKHSQNYSKYTGIVRTEKFEALKRGLKSQQSLFTKVKTEQEAATRASFRVALEIAKRGKPFTDGEMIKECIIAVVEEMCPEKVNLLKTVSMSANTVARRVENIAENISSQLFDKNGHVEWFSLALDESTDVSDTAQVLIYIRGVDKSYEVHEELLDMYSIHGTTTGTDIFKGVEMAINKKNLRWKNLKSITTSSTVFVRKISFGLNHRQFRQFIAEIGETDLPYHTAVRWLSCGKVLQRFFELRAVIEIFLNEKHRPLTELQNNAWLWKLAFYVDLTKHVNELNLRLQGENQHLPDLYTNIKSFRMKLILFQSQLRSKCFSHFKICEIFSHTTETEFPIDFAIETLSALKINFDTRFSDFDAIANQIKIFQNPFDADIETLAPELQMEMIDLQCSDIIKNKYENSSLLEFYKSLPLTQFDNLHKFARGLFSVFGTTYLCEKTFSKMKYTKNVYRSKLTDEHLKSLLIIGTSKISPQLQTIEFSSMSPRAGQNLSAGRMWPSGRSFETPGLPVMSSSIGSCFFLVDELGPVGRRFACSRPRLLCFPNKCRSGLRGADNISKSRWQLAFSQGHCRVVEETSSMLKSSPPDNLRYLLSPQEQLADGDLG